MKLCLSLFTNGCFFTPTRSAALVLAIFGSNAFAEQPMASELLPETDAAIPPDLGDWVWSGDLSQVIPMDGFWRVEGGSDGEILRLDGQPQETHDWLFLQANWIESNAAEDAVVMRWNGCQLVLYPTSEGWIPALGDIVFRPEFTVPANAPFEVGIRVSEHGEVDFAWNGALLLENARLASQIEDLLLVAVPPGYVMGLHELAWAPAEIIDADGWIYGTRMSDPEAGIEGSASFASPSSPGSDVPAPHGPPPPHPFIAMDDLLRPFIPPGKVSEGPSESLHAGGALVGSGKATNLIDAQSE